MEGFPKDNDEETEERKAEAASSSSYRCSHLCSFLERAIRDFLKCLGIESTSEAPPEQQDCRPNQPNTHDSSSSSSSSASDQEADDPPSRPSISPGSSPQTN